MTAAILRLSPVLADALDGLLDLAEAVNGELDPGQVALSRALGRARRSVPPPDSPTARLRDLMDVHAGDEDVTWQTSFRNCVLGLDNDHEGMSAEEADSICALLAAVLEDPYGGPEELTRVALSQSVCPMHLTDYANCFLDSDPECEAIRHIHPDHDT